jgi:glutamyl-tRNA reductase
MAHAMAQRPARPLTVVDIGVPRNVEEGASAIGGVCMFTIDDLRSIVTVHRRLREAEIASVEHIVASEVRQFMRWQRSRTIVPVITSMRRHAEEIARAEVELALRRLPKLDGHDREIVAQMAERIVNKLLHNPTVTLKERAEHGAHFAYSHATRKLFALDDMYQQDKRADGDE